jgi:hypothetical protein
MTNIQDLVLQDWIWIANHSMFVFIVFDALIQGKSKLENQINEEKLNKTTAMLMFYAVFSLLTFFLYFIFLQWADPRLTFVITLFETILRIHHNHTHTKSMVDEEE